MSGQQAKVAEDEMLLLCIPDLVGKTEEEKEKTPVKSRKHFQ